MKYAARSCPHWLWCLQEETSTTIVGTNRLEELTAHLPPDSPAPTMLLQVECHQRSMRTRKHTGFTEGICLSPLGGHAPGALLVNAVIGDAYGSRPPGCCHWIKECHPKSCFSRTGAGSTTFFNLLYPFVDVLCLRVRKDEDIRTIANQLVLWTGSPTTRPLYAPRLIIEFCGKSFAKKDIERLVAMTEGIFGLGLLNQLALLFSGVAYTKGTRGLPQLAVRAAIEVRESRRQSRNLFSVVHWVELQRRAFASIEKFPPGIFDCVQAAREDFPVRASMVTHFLEFVRNINCWEQLSDFAVPVIASSILVDHYTPGMHWLVLRIHPPTAGHGILCIDGGGVGGIVSSTILELVEDELNLPIPIQDHFSMAYGVSVGGLVVLALYENGWSARKCTRRLQTLARDAFTSPVVTFFGIYFTLKWLQLLLFGHLYSNRGIEKALQKAFGEKRLMAPSYATTSGTKFGVLTTSTERPSTYVFANYIGPSSQKKGYSIAQSSLDTRTWQVYFSPSNISGLGTFQDGGVLRNNPTLVGLSEFSELYADAKPDVVLNLGTGSTMTTTSPRSRLGRILARGWLGRLILAYLSFLQGDRTWDDVVGLLRKRPQDGFFRLNVALSSAVALDDIGAMPSLRSLVLKDKPLKAAVGELAHRLFAALFYMELTSAASCSSFSSRVAGVILCKRKAPDSAVASIIARLTKYNIYANGQRLENQTLVNVRGDIEIQLVTTTTHDISIELEEIASGSRFPISGSPFSLAALIRNSEATAVFGKRLQKRRGDRMYGPSVKRRAIS
ncbi:acyl transferase/acyl hydrolase/lysophospholipase [Microdochium trichocladiopsis]|uniref:Acyl transferase/acyl hydrolase/lysophospholipase n=1 Tax=Microdochium trichocladiopsis TaxID=1682393 RepID=A0A9P8Y6G8_9PEZI|nr:acyl transferase/acyl hydrolase/lysophospholipase [Microdochium trichocladiopsis]KAH7031045.1 acyl transferase/acyl hydrolase/lysophospholipase [Microdochium trichocladiopsis]